MICEMEVVDTNPNEYDIVIAAANYVTCRLREIPPPNSLGSPNLMNTAPAVKFFAEAMKNPRIVKGAMCHALWILTPVPELLRGRRVICHTVVLPDIHNAGAIFVPDPSHVVVDKDLITARSAADLIEFVNAIVERVLKSDVISEKRFSENRGFREKKKKVEIVLSSFGFWGEELIAPMEEFEKAGIEYSFSTPYGFPPRIVGVSMNPDFVDPVLNQKVTSTEMAEKVRNLVFSDRLSTFRSVSDIHVDDFDGLLLVGGSGPILDMANCRPLHQLIWQSYNAGKIIAAECYAIAALAFTRNMNEPRSLRSIIYGKKVTGHPLSHDYTTAYGYAGVLSESPFIGPPIPLEFILRDAVGPEGEFIGNEGQPTSVVVDLPFITARSVASSRECGKALVKALKKSNKKYVPTK